MNPLKGLDPVKVRARRIVTLCAGRAKESEGVVFDFQNRYWRVRHRDGDWEELNEREVAKGKKRAEQHSNGQRPGK